MFKIKPFVIQNTLHILLGKAESITLRGHLIRGTTGSFALKVIGTGLTFISTIVLIRMLGLEAFGIYVYVLSWINVLAIPSALGTDRQLMRNLAIYHSQAAWELMNGQLRWATRVGAGMSSLLALCVGIIAWWLLDGKNDSLLIPFWIGCLIIPLTVVNLIRQGALQGLRRVVEAQLPEMIIKPGGVIILLLVAGWLFHGQLSASWALGVLAVASIIAMVVGTLLLSRHIPSQVAHATPTYQWGPWMQAGLYFILISGMNVINNRIGMLMVGATEGPLEVATYAVASRGVIFIDFVLQSANIALAPTFASLYAQQDIARLQRVVTKSARFIVLATTPIAAGIIFFRHWLLLLFGPEFIQAEQVLVILSIGQIVNVLTGSVAQLLIVTKHEHIVALSIGSGLLLNVLLNLILVPAWGAEGAAIATTLVIVLRNVFLAIMAYRRLGIHSTAFGRMTHK